MTLNELNKLSSEQAAQLFTQCCASSSWVSDLVAARPFENLHELKHVASECWDRIGLPDLFEALNAHPMIGDLESLKEKYTLSSSFSSEEQAGVDDTDDETLLTLQRLNQDYLEKFGFIFIVCATGKSASEMLELLQRRINNNREQEITIAAQEQLKITLIRIEKLFN